MEKPMKSLLETVIEEVPNSPHPSPFPIEDTLKLLDFGGDWFGIGRRAVEILEDRNKIEKFMEEYIQHIHDKHDLSLEEAAKSAKGIVGYCTGYVDDAQANQWFSAIPDISHPFMGRERPFKGADNIESYYIIGKTGDEEIKKYLATSLAEDLAGLGFQLLDNCKPIPGKDNQDYFAFRIKQTNFKLFNNAKAYLFLTGYVRGVSYRMQEETGKYCKLGLEHISKSQKKQ